MKFETRLLPSFTSNHSTPTQLETVSPSDHRAVGSKNSSGVFDHLPHRATRPTEQSKTRVRITPALLQSILDAHESPLGKGQPVKNIPGTFPNSDERSLTLMNIRTGSCYTVGSLALFSQQSMSKPIAQSLAISLMGLRAFKQEIGSESSGQPYDSDAMMPGKKGVPYNPHVNIGALKVWDLIISNTPDGKNAFDNYLAYVRELAGNPGLYCNNEMADGEFAYQPEGGGLSKNRLLLQALQKESALRNDPEKVLKAYCQACAIMINTEDAARISCVIFNGGKDPRNAAVHMTPEDAKHTASSMAVSGFYDESGKYFSMAGFHGKTGVDGGVMGALRLPDRPDIIVAAHHSDLNRAGNSGEALKWIKHLSQLNLAFPEELDDCCLRKRALQKLKTLTRSPVRNPEPLPSRASPKALDLELRKEMLVEDFTRLESKIRALNETLTEQKANFYLKPAKDEFSISADARFLMQSKNRKEEMKYYYFVPDSHHLHKIVVVTREIEQTLPRH